MSQGKSKHRANVKTRPLSQEQSAQRKIVAKRRGLSMGDGERSGLKVATDNIVSQAKHRLFGRAICK